MPPNPGPGRRGQPADAGASRAGLLKLLFEPGLLQDFVRGVAGLDDFIDRDAAIAQRAEPYVMIAPAMPFEVTACFGQPFTHRPAIVVHAAFGMGTLVCQYAVISIGASPAPSKPFSSIRSAAMPGRRAAKASSVAASPLDQG